MKTANPSITLARLKACLFTAARATSLQEVRPLVRRANELADEMAESLLMEQLTASVEQRKCAEVGAQVVPFPQNITIKNEGHLTEASKIHPDRHLGAEEMA